MPKNLQEKEIAVRKESGRRHPPARMISPLRTWEHELDRLFEDFPFFRWPRLRELEPFRFRHEMHLRAPVLDVYEEKDEVIVKSELPGMAKDDIEIVISDSTLTLKGEKKREEEIEEKDYYRCEREYGSFQRTIDLPAEVKTEEAKATFKDGVLEVHLPKTDEAKKRQIHVPVQ